MATIRELRIKAKAAGIPNVRGMTEAELKAALSGNGKSASKSVAKKKTATPSTTPRKRGRPPGSGTKTAPPARRGRPPKAQSAPAPRRGWPPKNSAPKPRANSNGDSGRNMVGSIDWTETDGWNPREGSLTHTIFVLLRKFKGNADKVYDAMAPDYKQYFNVKRTGGKYSKDEALATLRYRISRCIWDFALATGQHEKSTNRAEYGTAGTGTGAFKRAGRKPATSKAPAKRGRPAKSETAPKRRGRPPKSAQGSTAASSGTRRGRPKGSGTRRGATRR